MRKVINNRQYAGRRFNKSVSLRSWGPVYDSATQDVTSTLLLLALYYHLSLSLSTLPRFHTLFSCICFFLFSVLSLSLSPLLCSHANLLFIKLKEHVSPRAYSNLPVWLSALQQNSYEALVDSFHDSWSFFRQKMSTLSCLSYPVFNFTSACNVLS